MAQWILGKYKPTTIQSRFSRSDLAKNPTSKNIETQKRNRVKYETAKAELEAKGVQFIESDNNVTFKF